MRRRGKGKFEVHVATEVTVRKNPIAFEQLLQLMRLAIKIADKSPEETERIQRIELESL